MKKAMVTLILLATMPAMAVELENGTYEYSLGTDGCDFKMINATAEGSMYLTMQTCVPQLLNFKLDFYEGAFVGLKKDSGMRRDIEIIVRPISTQAFKIRFNDKYYTGEVINGSDIIYSKKTSCK